VGATLLFDSLPDLEEQETRLKASAFLDLLQKPKQKKNTEIDEIQPTGTGKKVLLIDHQD